MKFEKFIAKTHEVMEQANKIYGTDVKLEVRVDIKGTRVAGYAQRKYGKYIVRLNPLYCEQFPEQMLNNTIPHEVAHIICFVTGQDDGHGKKWQKVAITLGCDGKRCHKMELSLPEKDFYYAVFPNGRIDIGKTRYNRVMSGKHNYTSKFGRITKDTEFLIVTGGVEKKINVKDAATEIKEKAKEVKEKAKEVRKTVNNLKKPAKKSYELYLLCEKNFEAFADEMDGKSARYIQDQFERCVNFF